MTTIQLCDKLPVSNYSTEGSSSGESNIDPEKGVYSDSDVLEDGPLCCFSSLRELRNSARMVLAELVGTFILMYCVCGIIASTQLLKGEVGLMEYAATGGLTIIVLIFSIGHISGAHVNPSVTIAFATLGQVSWSKVPFYILAQIFGSYFATYAGVTVYGFKPELVLTQPIDGSWKTAFWAELIATAMIMFLAASMSFNAQSLGHLAGFVVGVAIALAILVTGPVSGGSLNPARTLGPAVVAWRFDNLWLYMVAPTIGAVLGAYLSRVFRKQHKPCSSSSLDGVVLVQ